MTTILQRLGTSHSTMWESSAWKYLFPVQQRRAHRGIWLPDPTFLLSSNQLARPGLRNVSFWRGCGGCGGVGALVLLRESTDLAGPTDICYSISVPRDSRLGYLAFAWCLALIKGICCIQRPLLSSAPVCPYVISLFKLCLWLCQVLTGALSTGV